MKKIPPWLLVLASVSVCFYLYIYVLFQIKDKMRMSEKFNNPLCLVVNYYLLHYAIVFYLGRIREQDN